MSKIWILSAWLILGGALSTSLAFLASLHSGLRVWAMLLWGVFLLFQLLGWLGDDAFAKFFRMDVRQWWGVLVLSLLCAFVGLSLWLLS
ncbi:MAG: hypothetical protein ACRC8A_03110 [Microcoleaceae cyanobacterium]